MVKSTAEETLSDEEAENIAVEIFPSQRKMVKDFKITQWCLQLLEDVPQKRVVLISSKYGEILQTKLIFFMIVFKARLL